MSMTENAGADAPATGRAIKKAKKDKAVLPSELRKGAKKTTEDKRPKATQFEFAGRVESINLKGDSANGNQCEFGLVNKKGERRSFSLDPSDPVRFATMANLLIAAFTAERKVSLRTAPHAGGSSRVCEVEVRTKS